LVIAAFVIGSKDAMTKEWLLQIALIPYVCGAAFGLLPVFIHNATINARKQASQRRLDEESWENDTEQKIEMLFQIDRRLLTVNQKLISIQGMIDEHSDDETQKGFVIKKLATHSDDIYNMTIREVIARDFSGAVIGFKILYQIRRDPIYSGAYRLLENRKALIDVMVEHGLPQNHRYAQQFR
jgi:hypothetical protein